MSSSFSSRIASLRFQKLAPRHAGWVMPLLLSLFMTCVVSMVSTLRSVGFEPGVTRIWLGAWALSWLIAFPILLLILPVVRKLTGAIVNVP